MKLRSSLDSHSSSSSKMTGLFVTLALLVALSMNTEECIAQNKDTKEVTLTKDKDQTLTAKDKYFTQLLLQIQREMRGEDEKKQLQEYKETISSLIKEFKREVMFSKEKKEQSLDTYTETFLSDIGWLQNTTQVPAMIDRIIAFLESLKQRNIVLGQEKIVTWPKEISYDLVDTYIARFTGLKIIFAQKSDKKEENLLWSSEVITFLLQKKAENQTKEESYNNQIIVNDSIQDAYGKLLQLVNTLEFSKINLSSELQEKIVKQELVEKEYESYKALETNETQENFQKKVDLMQLNETLQQEVQQMTDSLQKSDSQLVVERNRIPVIQNTIMQNHAKLLEIQNELLDLKKQQYAEITERLKQESKKDIEEQETEIQKQMQVLQKTIDSYNSNIDSLTITLQKINENLTEKFSGWTTVIKQKDEMIQNLLKEYVRYAQELERLYTMSKAILSKNKEAILKLEESNPFVRIDVNSLDTQKKELENTIWSLKVSISAKEKEKSETKDDRRIIQVIDELSIFKNTLQDSENALEWITQLLAQRQYFEADYLQRKNKEIEQIDQLLTYMDKNIQATQYAIESFVYGYNMQYRKMEIQNVQKKIESLQSRIDKNTKDIEDLKNKDAANRKQLKNKLSDQQQKDIWVEINLLAARMRPIKEALARDGKSLEAQKKNLADLQKSYIELASLANESLKLYQVSGTESVLLKNQIGDNKYPYPTKSPIDIPGFDQSIDKLLSLIKDAWVVMPESTEKTVKVLFK